MNSRWDNRLGKLFIGGCGTQIGLVLSCGMLASMVLLCALCAFFNVLSIGFAREFMIISPETVAEVSSTDEAETLRSEIAYLRNEVEFLQANPPRVPAPPQTPVPPPKPLAIAVMGGANLRNGPGLDYKKVGSLPMGGSLEIVGRNADSSWWLVSAPNGLAWVAEGVVTTSYVDDNIPVVTIPALLVQPAAAGSATVPDLPVDLPAAGQAPVVPPPAAPAGTPIPGADASRSFVEDMSAYKRLRGQLLIPPTSASISPDGSQIALTERIKLYTVTTDGALSKIWLEEDDKLGPIGQIVWSPDGRYIAFEVGFKTQYCKPCRSVALIDTVDETMIVLEAPNNLDLSAPRWTLDGHLLVNANPGEPADGVAYLYDTSGQGQPAEGRYELSTNHYGQQWYPWLPGKSWQVGQTIRADSYNAE
jgi:hypothetical protein